QHAHPRAGDRGDRVDVGAAGAVDPDRVRGAVRRRREDGNLFLVVRVGRARDQLRAGLRDDLAGVDRDRPDARADEAANGDRVGAGREVDVQLFDRDGGHTPGLARAGEARDLNVVAGRLRHGDHVGAGAAEQGQRVEVRAALDGVVTRAVRDRQMDGVVARVAVDRVVATTAGDLVALAAATDRVVARRRAEDRVVATLTVNRRAVRAVVSHVVVSAAAPHRHGACGLGAGLHVVVADGIASGRRASRGEAGLVVAVERGAAAAQVDKDVVAQAAGKLDRRQHT